MRIGIILASHDPKLDRPSHFISSSLSALLLIEPKENGGFIAVKVSEALIWLKIDEPISSIKARYRSSKPSLKPIPRLLPPRRPINLDLSYPEPGRTSIHHPHAAFVNACKFAASSSSLKKKSRTERMGRMEREYRW
jgi:hypothetical protein